MDLQSCCSLTCKSLQQWQHLLDAKLKLQLMLKCNCYMNHFYCLCEFAFMYVYAGLCVWCPQKGQKRVISFRTEVTDNCELYVGAGKQPISSARAVSDLDHWTIFPAPNALSIWTAVLLWYKVKNYIYRIKTLLCPSNFSSYSSSDKPTLVATSVKFVLFKCYRLQILGI